MAVLVIDTPDGEWIEHEFGEQAAIGSDPANAPCLRADWGVAPFHAAIARSRIFQTAVLVDKLGGEGRLRVNGRRVVQIQVLRHRDKIEIGNVQGVFWEIMLRRLADDSPLVGKRCLVCYDRFQAGDTVVQCPRCQSPHHKDCWFLLAYCSAYACGYPAQIAMRNAIANIQIEGEPIRFETLADNSEPVKQNMSCPAGQPRDIGPFIGHDYVAYCPRCGKPYHLECWFGLDTCPAALVGGENGVCAYPVGQLINQVFAGSRQSEESASEKETE